MLPAPLPAPYRRAQKLLSSRSGAVLLARTWGVVQALLLLAMVGWGGLLLALIAARGEARLSPSQLAPDRVRELPGWIRDRTPIDSRDPVLLTDTGLFPLVARKLASPNPLHRAAARAARGLMGAVPPLRNNTGALTLLLALGLVLLLLAALVERARRAGLAELSSQAAASLRRQVHRQMYRLGQSALPTEGIGPVVNLFTREVNDVQLGLLADLDRRPRVPVLAAGLLLIALFISWNLTVFLAALGGLVWLTERALRRSGGQVALAAARDAGLQLILLQEDLGLLRTVRVYGMEEVDNRRFDEHLERFRDADARRMVAEAPFSPTILLLFGAAATVALGLLGYNMLQGRLALASAAMLVAALAGLQAPLTAWVDLRRVLRQAGRSAGALFEFLERRPELHQAVGAQFVPPLHDRIRLTDVTIQSASGRVLLDRTSLDLPAHSRTAIVGPDEDSKHALVCLIPRLIDPKAGRVTLDGLDLRDVTLESLRAQVATVLQADLVFSDSVVANIGLGDPSFGLPRIIEAAKLAHAHNFIQDLPHGYDTIIGPLGHYLKPDEQYRIALARAFLHDPSIVIIEEPTARMDESVKALIDDTLARLGRDRTLIFLPHRLSTIRSCDRVIVLDDEGRVESVGSPREVHARSKLFRHLQYLEFNQFATGEIEAGQMNA